MRSRPAPSRHGFTLVELVAVLAVLGLVAGLVAPRVASGVGSAGLRAASRQVAALCRLGRDLALSERRPYRLAIDIDRGRMWLEQQEGPLPVARGFRRLLTSLGRPVEFPGNVRVKSVASLGRTVDEGVAYLWFFPDMRQPTSAVYLERDDGGTVYTVEVAALTGRVRVYALEHDPLSWLHAS